MASKISTVNRQAPMQKPLSQPTTHGKAKTSAFDRFLIKLGLKTVKPAKDPLKTLVGSWNRLPKPNVDSKITRLKAMTVIRHSGAGKKLTTSERAELLGPLDLKMKPCSADKVVGNLRSLVWKTLADRSKHGELVARNLMDLMDSGSIGEAQTLLMDKILQDNPWMQKSGITSGALMDLARTGLGAMMDGLLPRAMEDAEDARSKITNAIKKKVGSLDDALKSRETQRSDLKHGIDELSGKRTDVKSKKLLDYDQGELSKRLEKEIKSKGLRLKDAEESWAKHSKGIEDKFKSIQDGLKSRTLTRSGLKDAINDLKTMRAEVRKSAKLLGYDQDVLTKRLDDEVSKLETRLKDAEEAWSGISEPLDDKIAIFRDVVKSRLTPRSGIKDIITELKNLRADVMKAGKLLGFDQDALVKKLDQEIKSMETRSKEAEEAWKTVSKAVDLKMQVVQDVVKSRYTPISDLKGAIKQLTSLRADVDKAAKLMGYDRDELFKRINKEITHLEMRTGKPFQPVELPGALSKLNSAKLSDEALRALIKLDQMGFLTDRFIQRFADSSLCSSIEAANACWPLLANGDAGIIDIVIGDNHWDSTALQMKLALSGIDPNSEKGQGILLDHRFTNLKRNLGEALQISGRFGRKVTANLPNSFKDIHADDTLLKVLGKLDPKIITDRNVILGQLVLMQMRVDGKDLKDSNVLAEAQKMLKTLGIDATPQQVKEWAGQGFRSTNEVEGVLKALHNFSTKLAKSEHALRVADEILDSSPKAYAQRGIGDISKLLLGFRDRRFAIKNPKQVDTKVIALIADIKSNVKSGAGMAKLTGIANARDGLVKNIENAEKRIKNIEDRMKNRVTILDGDNHVKKDIWGKYRGLTSGTKALDVLRLQDGIEQMQKRLGPNKTSNALKFMINARNDLLKGLDDYDTEALHTPKGKSPSKLVNFKTPEDKIAVLRNRQKVIQAIVDNRLDAVDLKPIKNDLKKLKGNLKTIDKTYNKALGRVEEERIRDFVHLAILRVFEGSGKDFKTFKLADHKQALDKQLKDWKMGGPALKVVLDRVINVQLSHDVIKQWTTDAQKLEERNDKISKEIDKLLGNKELAQSLAAVRAAQRIGDMMNSLGKNEGVSLTFGLSGSIETADLPIGAGDAKLSLRMQAAAFDSINIRNTGNGFEVMIKGGGSGTLSASLTGLFGLFEGQGNVKAEHMSGAQFMFKSKKEATQFLTDVLSGKITEKTLSTVKTIRAVTDSMGEVSLKVKAGYSNEKEKDLNVPNVNKTATFGLAVEIQAKAGVSAQFTKGLRHNNQIKIQTYSRTYDINARVDATLTGKVRLGDKGKQHDVDGNIQYRKKVTHGVEIHSTFGTVLADTCVKTGMLSGDDPLVTLSALLPESVRSKLDPTKLQTLVEALDGNTDKMITLESRITQTALDKINDLRSKGASLIKQNKKTEGQKLMQEAEKLLGDPKSYAPTRIVIDADVFKTESQKVKSLLGGKVEFKQFGVGERTFNGFGLNIKDLLAA